MKRVCAWCRRDMGRVDRSFHPDTLHSHGICEQCVDNLSFQQGVSYQDYIDSFPLPILLVGLIADTYIITKQVNRKACEVLDKEPLEMVQHLSGNVFECAHARLPEGCGRTIHCSGCAIRRAVMETFRTGKPRSMVPATLKRSASPVTDNVHLTITTVKAGELVILRVEEITARSHSG